MLVCYTRVCVCKHDYIHMYRHFSVPLTFLEHTLMWKQCLFPPQAERAVLDVGETLVGSYRSIEVPLVNNSPCPVSFCLSVQQTLLDEEHIYDAKTEPSGILFCVIIYI